MSTTITYNLNPSVGGGRLLSFTYGRSLSELIGTWAAEVAGGSFQSGGDFSVDVMQNGIITSAHKTPQGSWVLSGRDAGVRLMKTTPHSSELAGGGASSVISDLASYCGVPASVGGGLGGFNVRSAVTATTCGEAILELCLISGLIAYIDNNGRLVCAAPSDATPSFPIILDDTATDLDLDGYANRASCTVTRRKKTLQEEAVERGEDPEQPKVFYKGTTPGGTTTIEPRSGSYSFNDAMGVQVSGTWEMQIIQPLGIVKTLKLVMRRKTITITIEQTHDYLINTKTVWRTDQEFRLFAFSEQGYTMTKTTEGTYQGATGAQNFKEVTTETMERGFDIFFASYVPRDWQDDLPMVNRERLIMRTERTGGLPPGPDMPLYSPPFDTTITRDFSRQDFGRGLLCTENESSYEKRELGTISAIAKNGEIVRYSDQNPKGIVSHRGPQWVLVEKYRTAYERYTPEGQCEISVRTEWDDDGSNWLFEHGIASGDAVMDQYIESYAKFTDSAQAMDIRTDGSTISASHWQYLDLPGRERSYINTDQSGVPVNSQEWYLNGQYVPSKYCPHFKADGEKCGIYGISVVGDFDGEKCPYRGINWISCIRAKAALEQARSQEDRPMLEAPVVEMASGGIGPKAWVSREIYVDEIISESAASSIARSVASNMLKVKGIKGIKRTVLLPYSPNVLTTGTITDVSHDWAALTTTVSYRIAGPIPECMIPSSAAGIAAGISDRNSNRQTRGLTGVVQAIDNSGTVFVKIGDGTYPCTTRLRNLGVGDSVVANFVSGNSIRGHITTRL